MSRSTPSPPALFDGSRGVSRLLDACGRLSMFRAVRLARHLCNILPIGKFLGKQHLDRMPGFPPPHFAGSLETLRLLGRSFFPSLPRPAPALFERGRETDSRALGAAPGGGIGI